MIDYLARAARCATVNQFNRLHIGLDALLAPTELAEIGRLSLAPGFPQPGQNWLDAKRKRSPGLFSNPQPFARRDVTDRLIVYEGAGPTRGRRLLIAFTGVKPQMMIPNPEFLQAVDARRWDVVCLKWSNNFLDGVEGVADSLDGVLARVMAEVGGRAYAGVSTIGVSAGGAPAVIAALRLRARRGVSVCGVADARFFAAERSRSKLSGLLGRPRLAFAYGAEFRPDQISAQAMADAWRGEMVSVPRVEKHNAMAYLLKRGKLAAFLERHL